MKKPIAVGLTVAAILVCGLAIIYYRRSVALEAKIEQMRLEQKLNDVIADLKAPSETLDIDTPTLLKIAGLRRQSYERRGMKRFMPYVNVRRDEHKATFGFTANGKTQTYHTASTDDAVQMSNHSFEHCWFYIACNAALQVESGFDKNNWLGRALKENPRMYDERIRPHLVRMTHAWKQSFIMRACRARIAAGERSDDIRQALERVADREWQRSDMKGVEFIERLMAKAGWAYARPKEIPGNGDKSESR
jgi:hypothetical protein